MTENYSEDAALILAENSREYQATQNALISLAFGTFQDRFKGKLGGTTWSPQAKSPDYAKASD
jgi:hypothetical protein